LADEFVSVGNELEQLALFQDKSNPTSMENIIQKHSQLSEKWDLLVEQIRQIEGFSDFLKAVPFSTLQTSASEGPVIIVNISQYQSDAIILYAQHAPTVVSLPKATPAELKLIALQISDIQHNVTSTKIMKVL
jgi:hypothetical protein